MEQFLLFFSTKFSNGYWLHDFTIVREKIRGHRFYWRFINRGNSTIITNANGMMFGSHTALMIGIILFFRSGFANASKPIQQSLQMHLVDKSLRPAFSSLMNFVFAILSFLVGLFTRYILFVTPTRHDYVY